MKQPRVSRDHQAESAPFLPSQAAATATTALLGSPPSLPAGSGATLNSSTWHPQVPRLPTAREALQLRGWGKRGKSQAGRRASPFRNTKGRSRRGLQHALQPFPTDQVLGHREGFALYCDNQQPPSQRHTKDPLQLKQGQPGQPNSVSQATPQHTAHMPAPPLTEPSNTKIPHVFSPGILFRALKVPVIKVGGLLFQLQLLTSSSGNKPQAQTRRNLGKSPCPLPSRPGGGACPLGPHIWFCSLQRVGPASPDRSDATR